MKSILITGTSKGLGFELLKVFLSNNWKVYALARDIRTFSEITKKYSDHCFPIEGDVTDDNVSDRISKIIKSQTHCLDVLINNAGNAEKCFGVDNVTSKDLDDHFKVHVSGAFRIIKACFPFLNKSTEPMIVNVSSRKGSINKINSGAYRILFPYQIAKSAQNMLTACLNQELKDTKIKTYAIHPGNLKTDVAPPDADTEPAEAALKMFNWINLKNKSLTSDFYSIMDDSILDW